MICSLTSHCAVKSQLFSLICNFFPIMKFLVSFAVSSSDNCSFGNWPRAKHSMTILSFDPLLAYHFDTAQNPPGKPSLRNTWQYVCSDLDLRGRWTLSCRGSTLDSSFLLFSLSTCFLPGPNYFAKPLISDLKSWFCPESWADFVNCTTWVGIIWPFSQILQLR